MSAHQLLDAAGRPRSPATMPGRHIGRVPPNKGRRHPADPPTVDEIVAVMRHAGDDRHGRSMRGLIVVLWRAGLRIYEALTLAETDLNPCFGGVHVAVPGLAGRALGVGGEHEESAAGGALLVDLSDPLALLLELPGPGGEVDLLALLGARGARHRA